MSYITLIRHGQANSGAKTEADYDKLSPLGHRQAQWLGEYLRETSAFHTRLISGTLRRHVETADGLAHGDFTRDRRLNEMPYIDIALALEKEHGIPLPQAPDEFVGHLPVLYDYWESGRIEEAPLTFEAFSSRIAEALDEIAAGDGPALVVTSGGVIAVAMRHMLGLDNAATAQLLLSIMNTSLHQLHPIGGRMTPALFNAVPHLEAPDRHHAKTHV